jgi:hypothetical protein
MFVQPDEITNTGTQVNVERKDRSTDQWILRVGTLFGTHTSKAKHKP